MSDTTETVGRRAFGRAAWRLLPLLGLLYFVSFIDRVNVGFAALTMQADLGLSASAYGFGAGIFFIGYFLFEIPSNLILLRVGAPRWIAIIMWTWGLVSAATAFVWSKESFWVVRFILGVAEAGFFPAVILYLTQWFPNERRGRIMAGFLLAVPISSAVGAPLSTALLGLQGFGLQGWQWLFIVEGFPALLLGAAALAYLPNGPAAARWLSAEEKASVAAVLDEEAARVSAAHGHGLGAALLRADVWLYAAIYFGLVAGLYGLGFWLPQIVKGFGGLDNQRVGLIAAAPYALGALVMFLWGRHSDATRERVLHVALPALVGGAGFIWAANVHDPVLSMAAISIAAAGIFAALSSFWTVPTARLTGAAAAAGIALINAIGNLSGYFAPSAIGVLKERTGGYGSGLLMLGAALIFAGLLMLTQRSRLRSGRR